MLWVVGWAENKARVGEFWELGWLIPICTALMLYVLEFLGGERFEG